MWKYYSIAIAVLGLGCWACSPRQESRSLENPSMQPIDQPAATITSAHPTTRRIENHDEGKAWYWVLPDPLVLADGRPVRDARTWFGERRPEIFRLFESEIYGKAPGRPAEESFEIAESSDDALKGAARRKQVVIHLSGAANGPAVDMLMYLPAHYTERVPLFLCMSFFPLQRVSDEPAIRLQDEWDRNHARQPGKLRANSPSFPIQEILGRGYGFAVIYYSQIDPDFDGGLPQGVRAAYLPPGKTRPASDEWGTIAAWAWGASRAMDYLQTDPDVDPARIAIMGHSRLGKTALWTGAADPRFAMVVACSSGRGGASLARRNFGESIGDLGQRYGYQFCGNFQKYGAHVTDMPVDSHELLGLIAPRPLYLATASLDLHSDPTGEFEAAVAAGPIYQLLGARGLETIAPPPLDTAIMHDIGYHCHTGKHEVTALDWAKILQFADLKLRHNGHEAR